MRTWKIHDSWYLPLAWLEISARNKHSRKVNDQDGPPLDHLHLVHLNRWWPIGAAYSDTGQLAGHVKHTLAFVASKGKLLYDVLLTKPEVPAWTYILLPGQLLSSYWPRRWFQRTLQHPSNQSMTRDIPSDQWDCWVSCLQPITVMYNTGEEIHHQHCKLLLFSATVGNITKIVFIFLYIKLQLGKLKTISKIIIMHNYHIFSNSTLVH